MEALRARCEQLTKQSEELTAQSKEYVRKLLAAHQRIEGLEETNRAADSALIDARGTVGKLNAQLSMLTDAHTKELDALRTDLTGRIRDLSKRNTNLKAQLDDVLRLHAQPPARDPRPDFASPQAYEPAVEG